MSQKLTYFNKIKNLFNLNYIKMQFNSNSLNDNYIDVNQKTKICDLNCINNDIKNSEMKLFGKPNKFSKLLDMTYKECYEYFQRKYGKPSMPYFTSKDCIETNSQIKRTRDGLFIHHIDEDKVRGLSNSKNAILNPWEYQKPKRLVYCNLLEHALLHYKIVEEYVNNNYDTKIEYGINGLQYYLIPELNDIYSGIVYCGDDEWRNTTASAIFPHKNDYLKLLHKILFLNQSIAFRKMYPKIKILASSGFDGWPISNNINFFNEIKNVFSELLNSNPTFAMNSCIEYELISDANRDLYVSVAPYNRFHQSFDKHWNNVFNSNKSNSKTLFVICAIVFVIAIIGLLFFVFTT